MLPVNKHMLFKKNPKTKKPYNIQVVIISNKIYFCSVISDFSMYKYTNKPCKKNTNRSLNNLSFKKYMFYIGLRKSATGRVNWCVLCSL